MTRPPIECAYVDCGATFATAKAHMAHLAMYHGPDDRVRTRDVSCWRCAALIRPPATTCTCGFVHPLLEAQP